MTLEEKKNKMIGSVKKNIEILSLQEEILNKQKAEYMKKMELLRNYNSFNKKEIKEIVEYLTSKVEDKDYSVEKYHVDTISKSNDRILVFEYTFLYLVEESKKEAALEEIKEKYNVEEKDGKNIISSSSIMRDDDISDNYVKLAFYNRYSDRLVKFTDQKEAHIISIDIKDERFNYINSFIEELLNDRLDRNSFNIPMGVIKLKADNFALKQKHKKKLVLESE